MQSVFEYSDILNAPVEVFHFDTEITKPFPVETHRHYYAEFILVTQGKATVAVNDKSYTVNKGELVIIPPQAMHSIFRYGDEHLVFRGLKVNLAWVGISGTYIPRLDRYFLNLGKLTDVTYKFHEDMLYGFDLEKFYEHILKEMTTRNYGYDSIINASIQEFIINILRAYMQMGITEQIKPVDNRTHYAIEEILSYIDSNSEYDLRVSDIAEKCNMSYSYFAKSFKEIYGQSCKEYIETIRLNKAEKLLKFTDMDIAQISQETGFSDSSHLIKCFRNKYNITPKQFRMKNPSSLES